MAGAAGANETLLDPILQEVHPPGPGAPGLPSDLPSGESLLYFWYPLRPLDQVHQHLYLALRSIAAKRDWLDQRWNYYLGRHSERVLSHKFRDVYARNAAVIQSMFSNYCGLAVRAPLARLQVVGFKGDGSAPATDLWEDNDLDTDAEEVHRHAILAGEAYVIVWPATDPETGEAVVDAEGPRFDIALQDSRNMYVHYRGRSRRQRLWASKVWLDVDLATAEARWRVVMYYPDEIIRLRARATSAPGASICPWDPIAFELDPDDPGGPHPMGSVPVVRFFRDWDGRSILDDCIPVQDRINKLTADRIVAGEFGAFPQRYALTNDDPPLDALRAGPGAVWVIPPSSTSGDSNEDAATTVGQFQHTDLANYGGAIEAEVNTLFMLAQLPRHLLINPGVAPSGQAILADEGPMIAHVRGYRDQFSKGWRDVLELCGITGVQLVWQDVEVKNELAKAQTFQALTTSGMPIRLAAEVALGLPEDQLAELDNLPLPPQPGAAAPAAQQSNQPAPEATPATAKRTRGK